VPFYDAVDQVDIKFIECLNRHPRICSLAKPLIHQRHKQQ